MGAGNGGNGDRDEVATELVINLHRSGRVSVQGPAAGPGVLDRGLCYNMLGQAHEIVFMQAATAKFGPKPLISPVRLMPPGDVLRG